MLLCSKGKDGGGDSHTIQKASMCLTNVSSTPNVIDTDSPVLQLCQIR